MKIIATMPCRNEDWCLGLTLRAVLMWADAVVVLDHASTDDTPRIIQDVDREYPGRVFGLQVPDPTWYEMAHRQAMLQFARGAGATHVAIVDADEVLTGNLLFTIRDSIANLAEGRLLQLPWTCLAPGVGLMGLPGISKYYSAGVWGTNWVTMAFSDLAHYGWATRDGYDFHHRHPIGSMPIGAVRPCEQGQGGLMHLQFSSRRRLKAKQALYKITEVLRWPERCDTAEKRAAIDAMYDRAVYESEPASTARADVPAAWWAQHHQLLHHLRLDAEPWQEAAVRLTVHEHGREKFQGLDLFGVA